MEPALYPVTDKAARLLSFPDVNSHVPLRTDSSNNVTTTDESAASVIRLNTMRLIYFQWLCQHGVKPGVWQSDPVVQGWRTNSLQDLLIMNLVFLYFHSPICLPLHSLVSTCLSRVMGVRCRQIGCQAFIVPFPTFRMSYVGNNCLFQLWIHLPRWLFILTGRKVPRAKNQTIRRNEAQERISGH